MKQVRGNEVLITGANGFIGSILSKRLEEADKFIINRFDINDGDIASYDFSGYNVQHVCHLAARTFVPQSTKEPYEFYKVNLLGTINMLEYCRKHDASMTFISTYMYGTPLYLPIDENHPRKAHSVYNHTKFLAEEACAFYHEHFDVSVTILRLFNVYGAGQSGDFLVPSIIHQALSGNRIEVMDLTPRRDFVYIDDVVDAICLTIMNEGFNIYNVGSGVSFTVQDAIDNVCSAIGETIQVIEKKQPRKNEVFNVVADISKIKSELDWSPSITFSEGIRRTVVATRKEMAK